MSLAVVHARYLILEQFRIPVAVLSVALFPALVLVFFVLPFDWAGDSAQVTRSIAQLALFGVLSGFLFTFGVGVADDREMPWDPYLRTLPAPPSARIAARLAVGAAFAMLGVIPVVALGALFTPASATAGELAAAFAMLLVAGLPFLFGGLAIGYSMPTKAALPVTQLVFFPMAFGGGLLMPPEIFPEWLQRATEVLPTRGARDLLVWTLGGTPPSALATVSFALWTIALAGVAGWAYRRDEGRRFR